jgi:hypothetical protein
MVRCYGLCIWFMLWYVYGYVMYGMYVTFLYTCCLIYVIGYHMVYTLYVMLYTCHHMYNQQTHTITCTLCYTLYTHCTHTYTHTVHTHCTHIHTHTFYGPSIPLSGPANKPLT